MDRIKDITAKLVETQDWPEFGAGDTVTVTIKIKEGSKERLQAFQGVVIQRRGSGATETFTVRKMASGVGVERIFPISSPSVEKIEVNKRGRSVVHASTTCVSAPVSLPASRSAASRSKTSIVPTAKCGHEKSQPTSVPIQARLAWATPIFAAPFRS